MEIRSREVAGVLLVMFAAAFVASGQQLDKAKLCADKALGLRQFEANADTLRGQIRRVGAIMDGLKDIEGQRRDMALENLNHLIKIAKESRGDTGFDMYGDLPMLEQVKAYIESLPPNAVMGMITSDSRPDLQVEKDLKAQQTFVANQIFLLRDQMKYLGCDPTPAAKTFDPSRFPFFRNGGIWDFKWRDSSVTTSNGKATNRLFTLEFRESIESGRSIPARLIPEVPYNLLVPGSYRQYRLPFDCQLSFDGDALSLDCNEYTGRFVLTLDPKCEPQVDGPPSYKDRDGRTGMWNLRGTTSFYLPPAGGCSSSPPPASNPSGTRDIVIEVKELGGNGRVIAGAAVSLTFRCSRETRNATTNTRGEAYFGGVPVSQFGPGLEVRVTPFFDFKHNWQEIHPSESGDATQRFVTYLFR